MNEEWRKISINNNYSVSNMGRVRNDRNNHIFTPCVTGNTCPYMGITLPIGDGKYKRFNVHRLVALAFLGKPSNESLVVNHIDGNKLNNRADNLEWTTRSENDKHAYRMGLRHSTSAQIQKAIDSKKRKVTNLTLGTTHESIVEASKYIGGQHSGVSKVLSGERKTYYGMQFAYAD